jgi:hypothetical protein
MTWNVFKASIALLLVTLGGARPLSAQDAAVAQPSQSAASAAPPPAQPSQPVQTQPAQPAATGAPAPVAPLYTSPSVSQAPPAAEGSIKDISVHRRPMALSMMAFVPWWYGIGIGPSLAFEIPIVHDGFIPRVNDQFSIEPSFSFAYTTWRDSYDYYNDDFALMFRPAVAALWSFHFSSKLRAYAEVNIGYTRVNHKYDVSGTGFDVGYNYFYGELNVGMFYNFSQRLSLRAEMGFMGLRTGLALLI